MKMEQTECSETLAYKIQMLGDYPEESTEHSEHGKSLKSRLTPFILQALGQTEEHTYIHNRTTFCHHGHYLQLKHMTKQSSRLVSILFVHII
jgi:hypothetical protein